VREKAKKEKQEWNDSRKNRRQESKKVKKGESKNSM
jgi:hypothetical protein